MSAVTSASAPSLRRLYFTRFAFALVWAALLATTASTLGPFTVTLLVLYPLFDVAAAFADARAAKVTDPVLGLYVTVAVSSLAAAGVAVAASTGIPGTLRVWGSWAIVSGLAQLSVALCRRKLGGQWPLVLGGAGSAVAGTAFLLQAGRGGAALVTVAGYAGLGGIFFLVSALRLTFRAGERIR